MEWVDLLSLGLLVGSLAPFALMAGGGLASGLGSFLGQRDQASAIRQAMQDYMNYRGQQRSTFLDQPESQTARRTLGTWAGGQTGYDPTMLQGLKQNYYEDYGKGLADIQRMAPAAGVNPGGTYTPGRSDRVTRIMGENVAARRAEGIRDVNQKNAEMANSNARFATQALPTYLPGDPSSGTVTDPNVFAGMNQPDPNFMGTMLSSLGNVGQQAGGQMLANQRPLYGYDPNAASAAAIMRKMQLYGGPNAGGGWGDPYG